MNGRDPVGFWQRWKGRGRRLVQRGPERPPQVPPAGLTEAEHAALLQRIQELESRLETVQQRADRAVGISLRVAKLLAPFVLFFVMLGLIVVFVPSMLPEALSRIATGLLLGKLSALGGQGDFLFWLAVLGTVDVVVGLFLVWNVDLLHKVPGIGPAFARFQQRASGFMASHGWVRRFAWTAVVLIVIVPFQGTGAVMGSIVGRAIGIGPWRTFGAIVVGAYTGVALVLSGSAAFVGLAQLHPAIAVGFVGLLLLAGIVLYMRFFRPDGRDAEARDPDAGDAAMQDDDPWAPQRGDPPQGQP